MNQLPYFSSSEIKVFPTSRRSDEYDRNARINTEQNLISIVNRLTGQDSFVISGLTVNSSGTYITQGMCNIHGYLFTIENTITLPDTGSSATGDILYLRIGLTENIAGNVTFVELNGVDQSNSQYSGLDILVFGASEPLPSTGNLSGSGTLVSYYYLPIATFNGSAWSNYPLNTTKYTAENIAVQILAGSATNLSGDTNMTLEQFFNTTLNNIIVDDGKI